MFYFMIVIFSFYLNVLPRINSDKLNKSDNMLNDIQFYDWVAGLIDGDGYFYIRKGNRLTSLIITFDLKDNKTAQMFKHCLNGKLQLVTGFNAIRFLLHKREDIIILINNLNGLIRTENRIKQFKLICLKYGVEYKDPIKLEYNNRWFSGFFDSYGHISYHKTNGNIAICINQKYRLLLDELVLLYNGKVYNHSKILNSYRLVINKKECVLQILNNYFSKYPSRTLKQNRLNLIKIYYELRSNKSKIAIKGSLSNKAWEKKKLIKL